MNRFKTLLLTSLILAVSFTFLSVLSQDAFTAPTPQKESCVTDKCHATMGKNKYVHGPVATGDCIFCHKPTTKHRFSAIKDVSELCYLCHSRLNTQSVTHKPVKDGNCTGCHNPHQSQYKLMLRAAGADLCFLCHDRSIVGGKFLHGPVAVGGCNACHNAHQTDFPKLLLASSNELCFTCHGDKADDMKNNKFAHAPVQQGCTNCHNPHSGDFKFNFIAEGSSDLCLGCHAEKKQEIAEATVKHGGLETGRKCLACHSPHYSNFSKMLAMKPSDLCLSCHDREYTNKTGKITDMKKFLANNKDWHGPIKENDCSSCHNTHGSKNFRILRENFPPIFYDAYNPEDYKLCFMCHEKTLAQDESTKTLTGFRNGNRNLHFVHVNQQKGRTCRACHDAHATGNPRHIRDSVPFGGWALPVGFSKTKSGGQCLPGCHKMFQYDRDNPLERM